MFCEECNIKKATVHMKKIVQGKKEEIHLCEECAKEKDPTSFDNSLSIHNFLAGLLDVNGNQHFSTHHSEAYQCSQCGTSYNQFRQQGKLGCNQCYARFKEGLGPLVRKIHGNITHTGKVPKRTGGIIRLRREVNQLKLQLREAIHQQAFEKAAELRDQIKDLETRIEEM